jgi:hypothetical protein
VEGSVGKEHVYMLVSSPTHIAPAKLVQYLKGRSSRLIQEEFPELKKRYWGQHLWARVARLIRALEAMANRFEGLPEALKDASTVNVHFKHP